MVLTSVYEWLQVVTSSYVRFRVDTSGYGWLRVVTSSRSFDLLNAMIH